MQSIFLESANFISVAITDLTVLITDLMVSIKWIIDGGEVFLAHWTWIVDIFTDFTSEDVLQALAKIC